MDNTIKAAILHFIEHNGSATYADIEDIFRQHDFDFKGDLVFCSEYDINVVFWLGWNAAAHQLIKELIQSGSIIREPCHILNYFLSGKCPNYPLLRRYSENSKLKNEHWLPCVFTKSK